MQENAFESVVLNMGAIFLCLNELSFEIIKIC